MYNYALVLIGSQKNNQPLYITEANALEANRVLQEAIKLNPQSLESYRLLNLTYGYILEKGYAQPDDLFEDYVAAQGGEYLRKHLEILEQRINSQDPSLTARDYHEAGLICEKLGRHAFADTYYEMERSISDPNLD